MVRAKRHPATAIALLSRAHFGPDVWRPRHCQATAHSAVGRAAAGQDRSSSGISGMGQDRTAGGARKTYSKFTKLFTTNYTHCRFAVCLPLDLWCQLVLPVQPKPGPRSFKNANSRPLREGSATEPLPHGISCLRPLPSGQRSLPSVHLWGLWPWICNIIRLVVDSPNAVQCSVHVSLSISSLYPA